MLSSLFLMEPWSFPVTHQEDEDQVGRSCSPAAGRSWLNSELARTPLRCIEYIFVH